jgi:hypothetical protein
MATNECIPYFDNGDTFTARCSAAVSGKRFLSVSGPRVSNAAGDSTEGALFTVAMTGAGLGSCVGVSGYDAPSGGDVTVFHEPSIVVPVKAGASITAGQLVKSDATGQAIPQGGTGVVLGIALDTVASGADCPLDRSVLA